MLRHLWTAQKKCSQKTPAKCRSQIKRPSLRKLGRVWLRTCATNCCKASRERGVNRQKSSKGFTLKRNIKSNTRQPRKLQMQMPTRTVLINSSAASLKTWITSAFVSNSTKPKSSIRRGASYTSRRTTLTASKSWRKPLILSIPWSLRQPI